MTQARAGFLLKVADRIDARLDELAIAESRDQVFLFLFYFLFWSSFALFFSELMLTRDQMCLSMVLFCVFVLCLDYLHARTKPDNRFVCSCTRLFHVMLSWWVLTAWGLLANSFSKFRKRVVVYARWSACLMLVVDTFAKKNWTLDVSVVSLDMFFIWREPPWKRYSGKTSEPCQEDGHPQGLNKLQGLCPGCLLKSSKFF